MTKGDEMLGYSLETGDSCAMTIGSNFDNAKSEIRAVAEKDSTLVILPLDQVHQWMRDHSDFQRFILESFNTRLKEMAEALPPPRLSRPTGKAVQILGRPGQNQWNHFHSYHPCRNRSGLEHLSYGRFPNAEAM